MMKEWREIASALGFNELSNSFDRQTRLGRGCCAIGIDEEFLDEPLSAPETKQQWLSRHRTGRRDAWPASLLRTVGWKGWRRASLKHYDRRQWG